MEALKPFNGANSEESPMLIRRILHPTDLTENSDNALAAAINLATQNHADFLLVHALPPEAEEAPATLLKRVTDVGVKAKSPVMVVRGRSSRVHLSKRT